MLDWVVIAQEYDVWHYQRPFGQRYYPPPNTHYVPLAMSMYFPTQMIHIIAETRIGLIPVFDMVYAATALNRFLAAYRQSPFRPRRLPEASQFTFQPYNWLLDQYEVYSLQEPYETSIFSRRRRRSPNL